MQVLAMRSVLLLAAVSAAFGVPLEGPKRFTGHRLVSAEGLSTKSFRAAEQLGNQGLLDLWSHGAARGAPILFSVAPEHFARVKSEFAKLGSKLKVLESNIQKLIDEDRTVSSYSTYAIGRPINFNQFETYEQIVASLNYYSKYTKVLPTVRIFNIGPTAENRNIYGIRISNSTSDKPVIFMECGIHAREWAATSTCLYIIDRLITSSHLYKDLLDKYEFHIIPSVNPDGYVYTHTTNRLWRKNRSRQDRGCYGVDLNRNFKAGPHCGVGTSNDSCSDIFCGRAPFSEPETAALDRYVKKLRSRIDYYVSLHAFGQMWMFPFAYTKKECSHHDDLLRRAKIGVDAMTDEFGESKWRYGPTATTIYEVTGGSIDWAYETRNITKSFVLELPPENEYGLGARGFLLDKRSIRYVGKKTFNGLEAMWLS